MDKDGNLEDGVGLQVYEFDHIPEKKLAEEPTSWQPKSVIEIVLEYDDLIGIWHGENSHLPPSFPSSHQTSSIPKNVFQF